MPRFILWNARERQRAAQACLDAPHDAIVEIKDAQTEPQKKRYHAMLGDVAKQCTHHNQRFELDDWKRLCVDMFRRETLGDPKLAEYWSRSGFRYVPNLDGSGVVTLGEQTRDFPKYVASAFIEWLFAWGAEKEVQWTDPTQIPIEAYAESMR